MFEVCSSLAPDGASSDDALPLHFPKDTQCPGRVHAPHSCLCPRRERYKRVFQSLQESQRARHWLVVALTHRSKATEAPPHQRRIWREYASVNWLYLSEARLWQALGITSWHRGLGSLTVSNGGSGTRLPWQARERVHIRAQPDR